MKKAILLVVGSVFVFAGCSRVTNKLNRMFGSATPTPAATPAPTATPKPSPKSEETTEKATATPKPTAKPAIKK